MLAAMATFAVAAAGQDDLHLPESVTAGSAVSFSIPGSGQASLYLIGPDHASKRSAELGQEIVFRGDELQAAGRYVAVICSQSCRSAAFFVVPAEVSGLSVLVHPSRVPASQRDAISGVAFPYDKFQNLVLSPVELNVRMSLGNSTLLSRSISAQDGVAWFRANSGTRAGALQIVLSANEISVRRVVQQVASEPCNLRIEAQRNARGIAVQTQPMRDCAGNPVQDGTIVSFTATGEKGKSTVDAPAKQGVARAQLMTSGAVAISAASGVVMGNEVKIEAQP